MLVHISQRPQVTVEQMELRAEMWPSNEGGEWDKSVPVIMSFSSLENISESDPIPDHFI